ncbi:uncharacterized protein B0H18DRAFT_955871, partial [Fomitopsis serialis]|uniref:uncharacterized protein n=1 Tax=Fomitopsis serialis TaxID=139415 RepID=UPI00200844AC
MRATKASRVTSSHGPRSLRLTESTKLFLTNLFLLIVFHGRRIPIVASMTRFFIGGRPALSSSVEQKWVIPRIKQGHGADERTFPEWQKYCSEGMSTTRSYTSAEPSCNTTTTNSGIQPYSFTAVAHPFPDIILVEPDEDYPPILRVPFRLIPNEMVITVNQQSELTIFGEVPDNEDEFLHIKTGDDKTLWIIAQCFARHTADIERQKRDIRAQILSIRLFLDEDSEERRSVRRPSVLSNIAYRLLRVGVAAAAGVAMGVFALGVVTLSSWSRQLENIKPGSFEFTGDNRRICTLGQHYVRVANVAGRFAPLPHCVSATVNDVAARRVTGGGGSNLLRCSAVFVAHM